MIAALFNEGYGETLAMNPDPAPAPSALAVGAWNPDVLIAKLFEVDVGDPFAAGEDRSELDKLIRRS